MANADRKRFGAGVRGKGDGTGAMSEIETQNLPANAVLSNRDKARHSETRGLDSRAVQTEQRQDHVANRRLDGDPQEEG